jgi:hypothetical protein
MKLTRFSSLGSALALTLGLAVGGGTGCSKQQEVVVLTLPEKPVTDADIERDPWALMPSGAYGWIYLDTQKLHASELGAKFAALFKRRSFVPESAGFEPSRDLTALRIGLYAMQGADYAAIATGNFNPAQIEAAAQAGQRTPWGASLAKTSYSGRNVYSASTLAFSVLTPHTIVFGNDTGLRRVLDRVREGRLKHEVPSWFETLLGTESAPMVLAIDSKAQPISQALTEQLAFLDGLHSARVLGNFQPPGVNLAGTMSYADDQAAQRGATNLARVQDLLSSYGWLMALIGIAQPIRRLEARAEATDTKFVCEVDSRAIGQLLDQAEQFIPLPGMAPVVRP